MSDSEMQERIIELVQGLWADGYAEGSRGENVPPSKKRLNRTEAEDALMSLFTEGKAKQEQQALDDLSDISAVCMYLVPKSEGWDECHKLINKHLDSYQMLKFGKTFKEVNAEYLANIGNSSEPKEKK